MLSRSSKVTLFDGVYYYYYLHSYKKYKHWKTINTTIQTLTMSRKRTKCKRKKRKKNEKTIYSQVVSKIRLITMTVDTPHCDSRDRDWLTVVCCQPCERWTDVDIWRMCQQVVLYHVLSDGMHHFPLFTLILPTSLSLSDTAVQLYWGPVHSAA